MAREQCWICSLWELHIYCEHFTTPGVERRCEDKKLLTRCRMLAVMTFNVGYFLSVLGGSFLGTLLMGRFAVMEGHMY